MDFDQARELQAMRSQMLRFARLQLRDPALAEDAVQDAQLAAFAGGDRFESRSAFKTWVFAILRHKLVDLIRRRGREAPLAAGFDGAAETPELEREAFDASGHWQAAACPQTWRDPEASFEQQQFWLVFEACLDHLPPRTGRVFMMREFLGLETDEICREFGLSAGNCWVVLHRARLGLRACLEQRWFGGVERR